MRSGARRGLLATLVLTLALGTGGCGERPPPSIVLVTLDTVRCDHLGIHGDGRGLSPHLDRLAAEGLVHSRAFTTMPTTGPAHVSLFTGLYPSVHGALRNGELARDEALARSAALGLRERGYATAAFVSTLLLAPRATALPGFEIYDAPRAPTRAGRETVAAALRWLENEPRRPVLLWVHLYDAHAPYGTAAAKRRPVDPTTAGFVAPGALDDPVERAGLRERYAAGVAEADAALGLLLDGLAARLPGPTVRIVAGDHGEALDEHLAARGYAFDHGEFLDEDVVCVPLVLAGPGVEVGRSEAPTSIADLHATLLAIAGAEAEGGHDLRRPSDAERVATERRRLEAGASPLSRLHAAAAFDTSRCAIVGEAGAAAGDFAAAAGDPAERALLELASRHALAAPDAPVREADPADLRDALRSLGYAE